MQIRFWNTVFRPEPDGPHSEAAFLSDMRHLAPGYFRVWVAHLALDEIPQHALYAHVVADAPEPPVPWRCVAESFLRHCGLPQLGVVELARFLSRNDGPRPDQHGSGTGERLLARLEARRWRAAVWDLHARRMVRVRDILRRAWIDDVEGLTLWTRFSYGLDLGTSSDLVGEEVRTCLDLHARAQVPFVLSARPDRVEITRHPTLEQVFRLREAAPEDGEWSDEWITDHFEAEYPHWKRRAIRKRLRELHRAFLATAQSGDAPAAGDVVPRPADGEIDPRSSVAGLPAKDVQRLVRQLVLSGTAPEETLARLRFPEDLANDLLQELAGCGYLQPREESGAAAWEATPRGEALVRSHTRRYRRASALRAVEALLERVQSYDAHEDGVYTIRRVLIFGSLLAGHAWVGDVDLAVDLVRRGSDAEAARARWLERQETLRAARKSDPGGRPRDYPFDEVRHILRAGSPILKLYRSDDVDPQILEDALVLYTGGQRQNWPLPARGGTE